MDGKSEIEGGVITGYFPKDKEEKINTEELTLDEGIIELEFDNISQSFMQKYVRYSEKIREGPKDSLQDNIRRINSLQDNSYQNKNKLTLSPFGHANHKNFMETANLLTQERNFSISNSLLNTKTYVDDGKVLNSCCNDSKLNIIDLTSEIKLPATTKLSEVRKSSMKSSTSESRFTLPRRKKIKKLFEEFLVIGIENNGLEYINDHDELLLTPKIIYNYPNKLGENELKFNIKFLKNFCFNEGVRVVRNEICTDDEYDMVLLENNFFSKPKSHFCLLQQISPEDIQKYFIFGIKFEDFYVTPLKVGSERTNSLEGQLHKKNYVNIFRYEKTYLFISLEPLCNLYEDIFRSILNVKKLNFLHNMAEFSCIFVRNNYNQFLEENSEKHGAQINEILNYYYTKSFPQFEETIQFKSELNNISSDYRYPNPFNECFLAIEWLSRRFFDKIDANSFFEILIRILLEHSILFISENIELLTSTVLGFSYLIQPFKWPFIIIPNLPIELMNITESPVPFLIGILGDSNLRKNLIKNGNVHNYDVVNVTNNSIELKSNQNVKYNDPFFKNLKVLLKTMFNNISASIKDEKSKGCEKIYKKVFDTLKSELGSKIESLARLDLYDKENFDSIDEINLEESACKMRSSNNLETVNGAPVLKTSQYATVRSRFEESLNAKDQEFGKLFSQTQLFLNYFEEARLKK